MTVSCGGVSVTSKYSTPGGGLAGGTLVILRMPGCSIRMVTHHWLAKPLRRRIVIALADRGSFMSYSRPSAIFATRMAPAASSEDVA